VLPGRDARGHFCQRVGLVDLDPDLARADDLEQLGAQRNQIGALGRVMHQRRPRQEQRALLRQQQGSKGGTGPEALPKLTIIPQVRRLSSEPAKVSLPTPS
jgi:hypothetical protein